jgi:hypothetical protein
MSDLDRFKAVLALPYRDQATFFLNAFWPENKGDAEHCWQFVNKMVELDSVKKAEGNELDEFNAHRFLDFFGDTATVAQHRELLRELGLNRNRKLSLIEHLVVKYRVTVHELIARPQGDNVELHKARQLLKAAQDEINKIETRKSALEAATEGSGIKAVQAKNELAQLMANTDFTDLNRALLSAEAAVRKSQKMGGDGDPMGSMWWMDRELQEMKKYKPQKSRA